MPSNSTLGKYTSSFAPLVPRGPNLIIVGSTRLGHYWLEGPPVFGMVGRNGFGVHLYDLVLCSFGNIGITPGDILAWKL